MEADRSAEITGLLRAWGGGDPAALDRLTELVYLELRRMARRYMRAREMATRSRPPHWLTRYTFAWSM